jgi:hypothetical protein
MVRTFGYVFNIAFVAEAPMTVSDVLGASGDYPIASQRAIWEAATGVQQTRSVRTG